MKYLFNPCKSCSKYNENINKLNNCLYETISAFNGTTSVNSLNPNAMAEECILEKMKAMGRDKCDFQLAPPPIFVQTRHYLPSLLDSSVDKDDALQKCLRMCTSHEERLACMIDYGSLYPLLLNDESENESENESVKISNPYRWVIVVCLVILFYLLVWLFSSTVI